MPRLVVNPGSPTAWEIQLKPGANFIGRGFANDFKITDPSVSGSHCQVTVGEAGVTIKDLGSTNGTFINRTQVKDAALQDGQILHLGGVQMAFYSDAAPAPMLARAASVAVPVPPPPPGIALASSPSAYPPPAAPGGVATADRISPPGLPPPVPTEATTATVARPALAARSAPVPVPAPLGARPAIALPQVTTPKGKPSFGLGLLGAFVGALVGSVIYFAVFYFGSLRLGLLAIGAGYLAGLGAELLGRKEGSKELGMIAAVFTLVGVVGAQYCAARLWWNEATKIIGISYAASVAEAKKVVKAVPTGSEEEIRRYLAKENAEEGEKPNLAAITEEEIQEFRTNELANAQTLASGKVSKEEFDAKHKREQARAKEDEPGEGTFKAIFLLLLLNKVNLISLVAGAGLAYKVSSNA